MIRKFWPLIHIGQAAEVVLLGGDPATVIAPRRVSSATIARMRKRRTLMPLTPVGAGAPPGIDGFDVLVDQGEGVLGGQGGQERQASGRPATGMAARLSANSSG